MLNKTINYRYKKKLFSLNASTPYTDKLHLSVNNVLCSCVSQSNFIANPDDIIHKAIKRYLAEKEVGLIK